MKNGTVFHLETFLIKDTLTNKDAFIKGHLIKRTTQQTILSGMIILIAYKLKEKVDQIKDLYSQAVEHTISDLHTRRLTYLYRNNFELH